VALNDLDFLEIGSEWPPPSERERLQKYRENRMLWNNQHDQVYGSWWRTLRQEHGTSHEIIFNFHKRLSTLWADLVFGDRPSFKAGDPQEAEAVRTPSRPTPVLENAPDRALEEPKVDPEISESEEQETIDRIVETSGFGRIGYEGVIDVSRYGHGLFKIRLKDGQAKIDAQSPTHWFPVTSLDDQREILYHVLAWTFEKDDTEYLRVEIHSKQPYLAPLDPADPEFDPQLTDSGYIENRLYVLKENTLHEQLPVSAFFPERSIIEETRVDDFLIVDVPGMRASDEFFGKDDYQDIDSLILEYMARQGLISKVQDKHSDPNMYGDEDLAGIDARTGMSNFEAGGKFFPVREQGVVPGYITWDASQDAQFSFMDRLKNDLFNISETTPTSFGISETGYAESGTSLALRMVPTIAKARRIKDWFDPAIKKVLILAAQLEEAWGGNVAVPETINIGWKSGLPDDAKERAEIEAARLAAGNTSKYSSIKRLDGGTEEEIEEELQRIREDQEFEKPQPLAPPLAANGQPLEGEEDAASRAERILTGLRPGGTSGTNGNQPPSSASGNQPPGRRRPGGGTGNTPGGGSGGGGR
jgi:hypothetical protein